MTLRDRMSKLADRVRAIPARPSLDERPTTVTIRTKVWTGGRRGAEGGTTVSDLVLTPTPRVREVAQRDIAGSAGRYTTGDIRVGPITPSHSGGGGYSEAQLAPVATDNATEFFYILAGGVNGEYTRVDLTTDRSHSYFLVLRRRRTTP